MTDPLATRPDPPANTADLARLLATWEASSGSGSPHTARARRADLEAFGRWMGLDSPAPRSEGRGAALAALRLETARRFLLDPSGPAGALELATRWVGAMREERYAQRTIARRVANLRSLVNVARSCGLPWPPLALKGPRRRQRSGVRGRSPSTITACLERLQGERGAAPARDRAIVGLLYFCALRRSEVSALDLRDFDPFGPSIHIRGKGAQEATHQVPIRVAQAIQAWLSYRGRKPGPMFSAVRDLRDGEAPAGRLHPDSIRAVTQRHGLGSPHAMRHTAATQLSQSGRLDLARALLRHASLDVTDGYVDPTQDDAGIAARILAGET